MSDSESSSADSLAEREVPSGAGVDHVADLSVCFLYTFSSSSSHSPFSVAAGVVLGARAFDNGPDLANDDQDTRPAYHFDLASVPPTLSTDDPASEDLVDRNILEGDPDLASIHGSYDDKHATPLALSDLKRFYDTRNSRAAINVLKGKHYIKIDDSFTIPSDDKDLLWDIFEVCPCPRPPLPALTLHSQHRLDYFCRVPKGIGFHAVLPNCRDPEAAGQVKWSFPIMFTRRHWTYRGDLNVLAFNPRGAMLCIGDAPGQETVWWTLFPLQALEPYPSPELMTADTGPSNMDPVVARISIACILYMLDKAKYSTNHLEDPYPDVSTEQNFLDAVGALL